MNFKGDFFLGHPVGKFCFKRVNQKWDTKNESVVKNWLKRISRRFLDPGGNLVKENQSNWGGHDGHLLEAVPLTCSSSSTFYFSPSSSSSLSSSSSPSLFLSCWSSRETKTLRRRKAFHQNLCGDLSREHFSEYPCRKVSRGKTAVLLDFVQITLVLLYSRNSSNTLIDFFSEYLLRVDT